MDIRPRRNISEECEEDGGNQQDHGTTDAGGDLCINHQVHSLGCTQNGKVACAAHVRHSQAGSDRTLNRVETNDPAEQTRTDAASDTFSIAILLFFWYEPERL